MTTRIAKAAALAILFLFAPTLSAASQQQAPLRVAAAPCPPFVIKDGENLEGLGIFLLDRIAREMGVEYTIEEVSLNEMLGAISQERAQRTVDLGISCLSITAEREKFIDFSHSFYETYIGIAVRQRGSMEALIDLLRSPVVLRGLGIFFGLAAVVGLIFFVLERGTNSKLYTMETGRGKFIEAFLVGSVFITRGPINFWEFRSLAARVIATILAIGATFLIAGITAMLASMFTLDNLRSQVSNLSDLARIRTSTLELSTSSLFLQSNGIPHQTDPDLKHLIFALEAGDVDAVVFDEAFLRYAIKWGREKGMFETLKVLPLEFDEQNYGFALPPGSPIVEEVNQALLEVRRSSEWKTQLLQYLGR